MKYKIIVYCEKEIVGSPRETNNREIAIRKYNNDVNAMLTYCKEINAPKYCIIKLLANGKLYKETRLLKGVHY